MEPELDPKIPKSDPNIRESLESDTCVLLLGPLMLDDKELTGLVPRRERRGLESLLGIGGRKFPIDRKSVV